MLPINETNSTPILNKFDKQDGHLIALEPIHYADKNTQAGHNATEQKLESQILRKEISKLGARS